MRFWLCLLLFSLPLAGLAAADPDGAASLRSVWVTADQFPPGLENLALKKLSLARWQNGKFEPIPFQFDEMNQLGLVYFDGALADRDGKEGVFDGHDQLGFMWPDMGDAAPDTARPTSGTRLADISVSLPGMASRHVYLLQGSAARNDHRYVDQSVSKGLTSTPYYFLQTSPDNELNWKNFRFQGYQGQGSIVESLRMRMSGRMFTGVTPRVTLDNDNLKPKLIAFKSGPIRNVMLLKIHVVLLGIPVMTIYEQVSRYAARYQAETYARIPAMYRASLRDPRVAVSIVGNDLLGSDVTTALSNGQTVKVDGDTGAAEKKLLENGINNRHNWIYFNSQRNFIMMTHLAIPDVLRNIPVSLVYNDSKAKGDQPAMLPNLGYAIDAWPKEREMQFGLDLLFDNTLHGLTPERYLAIRLGTPSVWITRFGSP